MVSNAEINDLIAWAKMMNPTGLAETAPKVEVRWTWGNRRQRVDGPPPRLLCGPEYFSALREALRRLEAY